MTRRTPRAFSFQKRLRIHWRDGFTCRYCGTLIHPLSEELTLDHVEADGGDEDSNLVTACRSCNSSKGRTMLRDLVQADAVGFLSQQIELTMTDVDGYIDLMCLKNRITKTDLLGRGRSQHLVRVRREIAVKLRAQGHTYAAIAQVLQRKDHSTIVHMLNSHL